MLSKSLREKIAKSKFSFDLNSKILLIRHGESIFNREIQQVEEIKEKRLFDERRNVVKFTNRLFDSDLTETGIIQSKKAAERLQHLNLKYVFVSPLLRTLNTCNNILTHIANLNRYNINYKSPKVIVHPYIYEKVEDNCDFFFDLKLKMNNFISYDWSLFESIQEQEFPFYYLKFCDTYVNEEGKLCQTPTDTVTHKVSALENYFCEKVSKGFEEKNYSFVEKFILDQLQKLDRHNAMMESSESTFQRNLIFNQFLNEYCGKITDNEKILTVGHSIFLKHLTLIDYKPDELQGDNFAYLKNCEIAGYYI
jgi:broad specificity phosphatase PhoE